MTESLAISTHSDEAQSSISEQPQWQRGPDYIRSHLAECESQGQGIHWRTSLPAAMEEARRVGKPVLLQYSCFEHGRLGAPNL